jgi:hypothetical protein
MASISYAITVHNELEELTKLLNFLQPRIREEDEIVIQYDADGVIVFFQAEDGIRDLSL